MQSTIFDQAVASLTNEERIEMLKKITGEANYTEEVALNVPEERVVDASQIEEAKNSLSWWERLRLFISTFFFREDPERSLEMLLLRKTKAEIMLKASGYVDFNNRKFLVKFGKQLEQLHIALEVFRRPLSDALGEHRQEFYALLGAEECPSLQAELARNADPNAILELHPNTDNAGLRAVIERGCDDILREIGNGSRQTIRLLTRTLVHLERLVNFNFEKCLAYYSKDGTCSFDLLAKPLQKLDDILYSFTMRPPARLLQLLFVFSYHAQHLNPTEIEARLKDDLIRAAEAMNLISAFNQFPLTKTLKVILEDYYYNPNSLTGGEDWFNLYKKFWRTRIELAYRSFVSTRKLQELEAKVCEVLNLSEPPLISVYSNDYWPEDYNPVYQRTFAIVYTFYQKIYRTLSEKILRPILEMGNFQRRENRTELIEANSTLFNTSDEIEKFVASLDRDGEVGEQFAMHESEPKQLETITSITSRNATTLIQNTADTLRIISLILQGVAGETTDHKYAPLVNMKDLDVKYENLRMDLAHYSYLITQLWTLIIDVRDIEDRLSHIENVAKTKFLEKASAVTAENADYIG